MTLSVVLPFGRIVDSLLLRNSLFASLLPHSVVLTAAISAEEEVNSNCNHQQDHQYDNSNNYQRVHCKAESF